MRRIGTLVLALAAAIAVAGAVSLSLTPQDANGLSWRYYNIVNGTRADRQVDSILYRYPNRATVWPGRRIATSYRYYLSDPVPLSPLPCFKYNAAPYTFRALCTGWKSVGPVSEFNITMAVEVNWHGSGFKDDGWYGMEYRPYCNPVTAFAVTLNVITCGVLAQTYSTVTLGMYFSTTTQAFSFYPQTTVWWRTYIKCSKDLGICYEPSTVPAG